MYPRACDHSVNDWTKTAASRGCFSPVLIELYDSQIPPPGGFIIPQFQGLSTTLHVKTNETANHELSSSLKADVAHQGDSSERTRVSQSSSVEYVIITSASGLRQS